MPIPPIVGNGIKNQPDMFFFKFKWWWQLTIISLLSLVIYLPIIGNSFVNDDFIVIKKTCIEGRLNTDGFFRPLSDISIWLTGQLAGLHPWAFYLTGILVHAISTLLLLKLCLRWQWTSNEQAQHRLALLAGALFFTYPFHNESVAWILGRGALIADTLGIAALLILVSPGRNLFKIIGVCFCYFIGLGFYETIIVLPGMVFIYLLVNRAGVQHTARWMAALIITLLLHVVVRIKISGSLAGDYGANFFNIDWASYFIKSLKALGRVFLPPMDNSRLLIGLSFVVLAAGIGIIVYLRRRLAGNQQAILFLYTQIACFLLAMLVPVVAGVSTRTSESDRFLHFPSYFIAILTAFTIIVLLQASKWFSVAVMAILCAQVFLLEKNNLNWRKASAAVTGILDIAQKNTAHRSLYIINLPEEINGAFVFRVGFEEALIIHNIDIAKVHVLHKLSRSEELLAGTAADLPSPENNSANLPSFSKSDNNMLLLNYKIQGSLQKMLIPVNSKVVCWHQGKWIEIN